MKLLLPALFFGVFTLNAQNMYETDIFPTKNGDLKITCIGHGTLMLQFNKLVIHVDPVSREADYSKLPPADLILVTHHHGDHLDASAIDKIKKEKTQIIMTETCAGMFENDGEMDMKIMANGEQAESYGLKIQAIPAYNIVNKRSNGEPYHPEGIGNGYVLSIGEIKILIAGDTENIPEIKALENIDIAFLPMNLPYTMTPEMVADAAKAFKPKVLYPYHLGSSDTDELSKLMNDTPEVEVRIRKF